MNIQKNFLKLFTGASLSLGIISSGSAVAATVTYDFTIENLTGKLAGNTYHGHLQYDDSLPENHIEEQGFDGISSSQGGLKFYFDFLGNTFRENHDGLNRTQLNFHDGEVDSLNYRIESDGYDYFDIGYTFTFTSHNTDEFGNNYTADFSYLIDGLDGDGGDGDVVFTRRDSGYTSIPEPSSLIGIGAITSGLLLRKSKKS